MNIKEQLLALGFKPIPTKQQAEKAAYAAKKLERKLKQEAQKTVHSGGL